MVNSSQSLSRFQKQVQQLRGRKDQLTSDFKSHRKRLKGLQRSAKTCEKALVISQEVARITQEELEYRISEIVSTALSSVFPEPYDFRIVFEIKRGKTEARLIFVKDGEEVDPMTASGGGVVDVAALAIRLSCFLIKRPRPAPVFVLDEPFRFVSKEYQTKVADLLEELGSRLGMQFLIITHEEELKRGNIIEWGEEK